MQTGAPSSGHRASAMTSHHVCDLKNVVFVEGGELSNRSNEGGNMGKNKYRELVIMWSSKVRKRE